MKLYKLSGIAFDFQEQCPAVESRIFLSQTKAMESIDSQVRGMLDYLESCSDDTMFKDGQYSVMDHKAFNAREFLGSRFLRSVEIKINLKEDEKDESKLKQSHADLLLFLQGLDAYSGSQLKFAKESFRSNATQHSILALSLCEIETDKLED